MHCHECHLPLAACYCGEVTRAPCGVEVVVIRHASERKRVTGTARLIGAAVESGRVLDYGAPEAPLVLHGQIADPAWLLFPDPAKPLPPDARPKTLIVLDGTWPQARRMRQRIPELRGRPIMNLPGRAGVFLRQQRTAGELPTALAVADALDALAEPRAAASLRAAYASLHGRLCSLGKYRLVANSHQ